MGKIRLDDSLIKELKNIASVLDDEVSCIYRALYTGNLNDSDLSLWRELKRKIV